MAQSLKILLPRWSEYNILFFVFFFFSKTLIKNLSIVQEFLFLYSWTAIQKEWNMYKKKKSQSLASPMPSALMANIASASGRQGES